MIGLFKKKEKKQEIVFENHIVCGYASSITTDKQNERVDFMALSKASRDYALWGNVREQHGLKTIGKCVFAAVTALGLFVVLDISDEEVWEKIETGEYRGISMGGMKQATERRKENGRTFDVITSITIAELSIVDQPANDDCGFMMFEPCEILLGEFSRYKEENNADNEENNANE